MRGAKRYLQGAGFGLKLGARSDGRFVAAGGLRALAGKRRSEGSRRVKSHPHWVHGESMGKRANTANLSVELPRTPEAAFMARRALDDLNGAVDPAVLPDV